MIVTEAKRKQPSERCSFLSLTSLTTSLPVPSPLQLPVLPYEFLAVAMASNTESPKSEFEPTPLASISSIPQKRALEDDHSPAVPSPLNPEVNPTELPKEDAPQPNRIKSGRTKKESLKKREAKGGDSGRATPDPKTAKESKEAKENQQYDGLQRRYKVAPPKSSDFNPPIGPVLTPHHEVINPNGDVVEFLEPSDHATNKKNYRYNHCIADPRFPSTSYYRQTESEPFGPHMSFEDAAAHVFFDRSARQITTDKGFRMARGNVAIREGRWYWECKITQGIRKPKDGDSKPEGGRHVRMGWARREASLDAPVGFDAYSYGIRDVSGEKVFMSRPKDFFPPGEMIQEGDVIGLEIQLPSERLHRKIMGGTFNPVVDVAEEGECHNTAEAPNIVRDRLHARWKANTYFEKFEYHPTKELEELMNPSPVVIMTSSSDPPNPHHLVPALRTLPKSCIKVYKNGVFMGTPFEDLLGFLPPASRVSHSDARQGLDDGMIGYYPAVSVFRGGAAEVNFGPDFWCPPPGYANPASADGDVAMEDVHPLEKLRAVSERYHDQIAEDVVHDIIDEVDIWMQDGGATNGAGQGSPEVKELVQED